MTTIRRTAIRPDDPWQEKEYAHITFEPATNLWTFQCKHPEDGRRCNAKFRDIDVMAQHLFSVHKFRFSKARRFSSERKKDGKK